MSLVHSVQNWFQIIQRDKSDLKLAEQLLGRMYGYDEERVDKDDLKQLVNLFTAIRLDQMAKEGS